MNMFLKEMRSNAKALIIWSICIFFLAVGGMEKYTAYAGNGNNAAVFSSFPASIKALLGFGQFDVATIGGFFGMMFVYIELTVAIHAALLGAGILSKEERDKTTEFLMVKPVSRTKIITSKLLAALVNVTVINLVTFASSVEMVSYFNKGTSLTPEVSTSMLSLFIVQLIFLSLGVMLAAVSKKPKSSGSAAIGILLAGYVIARLTDLTTKLNILNLLSPFKYFDLYAVMDGKGLNAVCVVLSLALIAVLCTISYFCYNKRDLSI